MTSPRETLERFADPSNYVGTPRLGGLVLSPEGDRLAATVTRLDGDGAAFVNSIWALDPAGVEEARQLTRSAEGEAAAAFLPGGHLLFVSRRAVPPGGGDGEGSGEKETPALWALPPAGGEPWVVATQPGPITGVVTARASTTFVVAARSAPGGLSDEANQQWWKTRRKRKVSAVLYSDGPVRHWDHHLGPDETHLFAGTFDPAADGKQALRDLTPDAGQALFDASPVLSPDGTTVYVDWLVRTGRGRTRMDIVAIDTATGARRSIATSDDQYDYRSPAVSPDGTRLVMTRTTKASIDEPWVSVLWLVDLSTGEGRVVEIGDEPAVEEVTFDRDGSCLIVAADLAGHRPLLRVALDAEGAVTPLTSTGAWSGIQPGPDGTIYALRSGVDHPAAAVRLGPSGGAPTSIDAPGALEGTPGRVEEIHATAADGTGLRAWLVLPESASGAHPVPLCLWVHGGPVSSWNDWSWRWNPWLLASRGWAVLLPDPALSSGYGLQMLRRGWGEWGGAPYDDVMLMTDTAVARPDIDGTRTAMMGGSYGGYMANWIAGHTSRFSAIVSHASLWSLDQFQATTDWPEEWADEWGYPDTNPELYSTWSPDRFIDAIQTPMLVIHGERDYRCPVSESLRLWTDLTRRGVPSQFLWFGEENHWVLKPGDAVVWYETVLGFLDHHVLGLPLTSSSLL